MIRRRSFLSLGIDINIRQATPDDSAIIAEFNTRLADETESLRLEADVINAGVAAVLNDPSRGIYFVAEADGKIIGQLMITYEWSDWRNGNLWWIQSVYVAPAYRRRGIFRALFKHVQALANWQKEVCGLRLYMHAENAKARRTYESLGMKATHYQVFEIDCR